MDEKTFIIMLGSYCREFRIDRLDMTLADVAKDSNVKTLSGFEHGRNNNFFHVFKYINACKTKSQKIELVDGLNDLIKGMIIIED